MVEHEGPARSSWRRSAAQGFPRTHHFAQARSVFAVAARRCAEVFDPPGSVTLWRLPESIEEEFDARWEHWLDNAPDWAPFFQKVEGLQTSDLVEALGAFEIVSDRDVERMVKLRRSAEGRAAPLPGVFSGTDDDVTLLALGFARADAGSRAVPYGASYESVKRFVRTLAPTRRAVGVFHCAPGADYGESAVMVSPEEARRCGAAFSRTFFA